MPSRGIASTAGLAASRRASTPVAIGVAIEVPHMAPQRSPKMVETMATPDAVSATSGPRLAKLAGKVGGLATTLPRVGLSVHPKSVPAGHP